MCIFTYIILFRQKIVVDKIIPLINKSEKSEPEDYLLMKIKITIPVLIFEIIILSPYEQTTMVIFIVTIHSSSNHPSN